MRALEPRLIQVKIQFHSSSCGFALSAIPLPDSCMLLGLVRNGQVIQASDEPTIHCGDEFLGVAFNKGLAPALQVILKRTHPVTWASFSCPVMGESHQLYSGVSFQIGVTRMFSS